MKRSLIIYGKRKGHGKNRKNEVLYNGPCPPDAATNIAKWWLDAKDKERA